MEHNRLTPQNVSLSFCLLVLHILVALSAQGEAQSRQRENVRRLCAGGILFCLERRYLLYRKLTVNPSQAYNFAT